MTESGRALPMVRSRAARFAERLLCWSLAAGMVTAAVDAVFEPPARWWHTAWPLPWWLTGASVLAWVVLRAREKAARSSPADEVEEVPGDWGRAA
ncbi:hypothetical protein [Streptomyces glaucus]